MKKNIKKLTTTILMLLAFSVFAFSQQQTGTDAQNFKSVTLDGDDFELNQLKGSVAVLTFWSTKCMICVAEMPKLNKMVDKYEGDKVEFIGLTMNNPELVNKFLEEKTFKFTIIPNSLGVVLKYADRDPRGRLMMGYPAYFVVDQKGKVVLKTNGWNKTEKVDEKIAELLK